MKQIKNRLKKHMFWIGLISLVLMLVDNVLFCYFNIECSRTLNQIEQTICIILSILVFLGVLNNKPDVRVEDIIKTVCHLKINNNVCLETTDEVFSCTYSSVSLANTDFSKYSQYFLKNYLYINHFTCEYDYLTSYMSTSRKAGVSIYGMYVIVNTTT